MGTRKYTAYHVYQFDIVDIIQTNLPFLFWQIGSHAGAWEPEKIGSHAGAWEPEKIGSHAGAWEPENMNQKYESWCMVS